MAAAQIRSFLRHVAWAQQRRSQKQAALGRIDEHITRAKEELLKPRIKEEVKRTILDDLRDKITSIVIDEKLLSERQHQDEHTIQLLRARQESLESQLVAHEGRLTSVEKTEHQEHELFERALHDIEDDFAKSAKNAGYVEDKEEELSNDIAHEQDVRKKKIEQITAALRRIETQHERLSRKKNVDKEQLTRLARMISKHKKALENI